MISISSIPTRCAPPPPRARVLNACAACVSADRPVYTPRPQCLLQLENLDDFEPASGSNSTMNRAMPPPPPKPKVHAKTKARTAKVVKEVKPGGRWAVTTEQLAKLEAIFDNEKSPAVPVREGLAAEFGVTTKQVSFWFRNRRFRQKGKEEGEEEGERGSRNDEEGDAGAFEDDEPYGDDDVVADPEIDFSELLDITEPARAPTSLPSLPVSPPPAAALAPPVSVPPASPGGSSIGGGPRQAGMSGAAQFHARSAGSELPTLSKLTRGMSLTNESLLDELPLPAGGPIDDGDSSALFDSILMPPAPLAPLVPLVPPPAAPTAPLAPAPPHASAMPHASVAAPQHAPPELVPPPSVQSRMAAHAAQVSPQMPASLQSLKSPFTASATVPVTAPGAVQGVGLGLLGKVPSIPDLLGVPPQPAHGRPKLLPDRAVYGGSETD